MTNGTPELAQLFVDTKGKTRTVTLTAGMALDILNSRSNPQVAFAGEDPDMVALRAAYTPSKSRVEAFATDLRNGNWEYFGDCIRFDVNTGLLFDGLKRVHAVALTGISMQVDVESRFTADVKDRVDTGETNTLTKALKRRNTPNAPVVAAVTIAAQEWDLGRFSETPTERKAGRPTITTSLRFYEEHTDRLTEVARIVRCNATIPGVTSKILGAFLWAISEAGLRRKADILPELGEFLTMLRDHEGFEAQSTVGQLRERLERIAVKTERSTPRRTLGLIIKAWNSHIAGVELNVLDFRSGGANPEEFPVPRAA